MVTPSEMRLVKQNPNQQVVDWWIALLTHMEMGTFRQIQVIGIRKMCNQIKGLILGILFMMAWRL